MIQTTVVKGLHHATIFGEVQMREVSYHCRSEVKMGKNIGYLYKGRHISFSLILNFYSREWIRSFPDTISNLFDSILTDKKCKFKHK